MQFAVAAAGAVAFFVAARLVVAGLHRFFGAGLGWVRPMLSALDRLLVERVSAWMGLSDPVGWRRWLRMTGVLVGAAALGAFLPSVLAAPALTAGLVAVAAVFRRWAWDEEDRALGLAPNEKRVPGGEDFNDEALAALAAVFMLSSLLVWRLTGLHAFTQEMPGGVGPFLLYMISEALEALPIVGNVEVLGYENPSGVHAVLPSGGWIAFALRMALDLMVIGGLLKAIEIAGRIARGQDLRREDEAIRAGEPARVRRAVETLTRLSLAEDLNALERLKRLAHDPGGEAAAPRFRLMALDALDTVAGHRPLLASDLYGFNHIAANDLLQDPALDELGYVPAAHLQLFHALYALYERSQGEAARTLLNGSAASLAHAITKPGHSPFAETYNTDAPQPMTGPQRADLALRYAGIKLNMGEMVGGEGAAAHLNAGLTMVDSALRVLDEADTPEDWSRAWLIRGQLLTRLGQYDPAPEGDARLAEAEEAFAASARIRSRDPDSLDWFALRLSQGVLEMETARRMSGRPALDVYERASDLFVEAVNGLAALEAEPGWIARGLLNHAGVLMDAARIWEAEDEPDRDVIVQLADGAANAYLQAGQVLEGVGLIVEYLNANRGLARAYAMMAEWSDDPDALAMVVATRRIILEKTDQARDPAAWAIAALELSHAEHEAGKDALSDSMARTALDRLSGVREILERYRLTEALAGADKLVRAIRATLARFGEVGTPPPGRTLH